MTWPAQSFVSSKHKKTWRQCRHMPRWISFHFCLIFTNHREVNNQNNWVCVSFRSLTSLSGVTNTWRKDFRRSLKRFAFAKGIFTETHSNFPGQVSEFMTMLFQLKCQQINMFNLIQSTRLSFVCFLAAAVVPQGLYWVWAQQASHASRNSAGQRQSFCSHSKQPLQWEPRQRRYLFLCLVGVPSLVCFYQKKQVEIVGLRLRN